MIKFRQRRWAWSLGLVCALLALSFSVVHGQGSTGGWSEPQLLLQAPPNDNGTNPIVYTGPSNNTHLLYFGRPAGEPDGPISLYYARWLEGGWTTPMDVLVTPDGGLPPTLTAVEDSQGYLHVIWNTSAVWYTRVHLEQATDLRSWQTPVAIYGERLPLEVAAAIDRDDQIHLVVSTRSNTLDYIPLSSEGAIGTPVQLNAGIDKTSFPYRISIIATAQGRLLTCWAESGAAEGVWCASSDDRGSTWNAPEIVVMEQFRGTGARLVYFPVTNQVGRIIWASGSVGGRYLQLSEDDGITWSAPIDLTQGVYMTGYTGQVAAMDSARNIHVLINPGDGRYIHVATRNDAWLPGAPTGWRASDWIEMAVAEGNTLVVVYWVMGNTFTSHLLLDAPRVAPLPVASSANAPAEAMAPQKEPTPTIQPTTTPTLQATTPLSPEQRTPEGSSGPAAAILTGVIPAVILVLGVVLFHSRRRG